MDIAVRFTGWLSPEFELYLIDEIKRLKKVEEQKNSFELLTHDEVLSLIKCLIKTPLCKGAVY